jgi:hypothetical protein
MLKAAYSKYDPLNKHLTFKACGTALERVKEDPSLGEDAVYVYYHAKENETVMTSVEGDVWGDEGYSAGFRGRVECGLIQR